MAIMGIRRWPLTVSTDMPKSSFQFLVRLFRDVLPLARVQIDRWTQAAAAIPNETLREQALASLTHKRFHADGGCVYAAVHPAFAGPLVKVIVALQTISDYLDNLCDRCDLFDAADFRQLHHAMRDAVRPGTTHRDYYRYRSAAEDGGYLDALVTDCQQVLGTLPNYTKVQTNVTWLVERYCELQEHKHIAPEARLATLQSWWNGYLGAFPEVRGYEFAAASGSTLGMFSLFLAATLPCREADVETLYNGYFPWVCGLHILLDYWIDLEEDKLEGDFNFIRCYPSLAEARARIRHFAAQSLRQAKALTLGGRIHRYVVQGLLGMYLSDDKVKRQRDVRKARRMVWAFGPTAWMFYGACVVYRVVR